MHFADSVALIVVPIALLVPLAGSTFLLIKNLVHQVSNWKHLEVESSRIFLSTKMILTIVMLILGVFFGFFLICRFWFPDYHIPIFWKVSAMILFVPYWVCIFGLAYGLSSVVGIANVSSARMFSQLFGMKSKSDGGTKQEVKKHKTANNSEAQPGRDGSSGHP